MATTGKIAHIKEALYARVEALATSLGVRAAYPNSNFVPNVNDAFYIEAKVFPNAPKGQGLRTGVMDQGLLIISGVFPRHVGDILPSSTVDAIKAYFPKNLKLNNGGFQVSLPLEPFEGPSLTETARYSVPVTVEWVS